MHIVSKDEHISNTFIVTMSLTLASMSMPLVTTACTYAVAADRKPSSAFGSFNARHSLAHFKYSALATMFMSTQSTYLRATDHTRAANRGL